MVLEWKTRTAYALTELVAFAIGTVIVVYVIANITALMFFKYFKSKYNPVLWQRELFEAVFTTAITFSPIQNEPTSTNESRSRDSRKISPIPPLQSEATAADGGQGEIIDAGTPSSVSDLGWGATDKDTTKADKEIGIVFVGFQEHGDTFSGKKKKKLVKVWVHVYFALLCGLVAFWFLAIFSDSLFYRKTNSCLDLSVSDTDATCFLLSTKDVPPGVQQILDEEEGELVDCPKVQNYLSRSNSTYDLEVICYQSQLSPLAAVGVAYGAMKAIVFAITTVLSAILKLSAKLGENKWPKRLIFVTQIIISIVVVIIIVVVPPSLHSASEPRNTSFDFLRGERFFSFSVIALLAISTVILLGLFPWWAFKRLDIERLKGLPMQEYIQGVLLYYKFFPHTGIDDVDRALESLNKQMAKINQSPFHVPCW